jgi:hypothetical protein
MAKKSMNIRRRTTAAKSKNSRKRTTPAKAKNTHNRKPSPPLPLEEVKVVAPDATTGGSVGEVTISIPKPAKKFSLDNFKSKRPEAMAGVATLQASLPCHKISEARDFVRIHPDEAYWSDELCFVPVPIQGVKKDTLHLIDEEVALRNNVPSGKIQRFRLVLASKPHDVFFLAHVPSRNLDNSWNVSVLDAAEQGRSRWIQATSQKERGIESYKIDHAVDTDAFPPPKWPTEPLEGLIIKTFEGRLIDHNDHPALGRLLGKKPPIS